MSTSCRTASSAALIAMQGPKEATRKQSQSLKKSAPESPGRKPRVGAFNKANAAAEAEARGPKKLSQVKVDPNIAKSLGVPSRGTSPAPTNTSAASQNQDASAVLDLFADSQPSAPDAAGGTPVRSPMVWSTAARLWG